MRTKWFVAFVTTAMVIFMTSTVMADLGDLAYEKVQALVATGHNSGNTSGTILNPEGRGDVLIFPYYDVREINGKTQDFYFAIVNTEWNPARVSLYQLNVMTVWPQSSASGSGPLGKRYSALTSGSPGEMCGLELSLTMPPWHYPMAPK